MRRREEERKKINEWSKVQNENSGEMKFLAKKRGGDPNKIDLKRYKMKI